MSLLSRRAADFDGHHTTVTAADGTPIAVRDFGPAAAPVTVVFVHGHCLRTESWTFLREHLQRHWGADIRMVFYDHRGHGDSGVADPRTYTVDQLAQDLDAVLRTVVPTGPVVLVGHSMGAMVTLAYARLYPETIGSRVAGVGLIAGAANGVTRVGLGRFLSGPAVSSLNLAVRRAPRFMQASKHLSRRFFEPIMREAALGTRQVSPRVLAVATTILNETPLLTMSAFLDSLIRFDETATLHRLGAIPTLVLAGSADIVIPFAHSVVLASQLDDSELVRIDGAGHSVILERAEEVAAAIVALVDRALAALRGRGPELGPEFAVAG
ncbi:alpha/beta hydrolase [Nocardia otitidiscaviarum]|uniref:alpha/beta fold hydrolase n=1 Tax=Nocardia otitidiscaviarum TaxID=1823 RepID=UPI0004A6BEA2|nr:alpha/beta hydrolase [Nocardia otitidiscaviarum]MBF6135741.1 alpha/beta hydrolase [Nocardia otitidiscaviarum]MBF6483554.1 alpha/beta hydrolase [Nocardia otitidiscaviarum]